MRVIIFVVFILILSGCAPKEQSYNYRTYKQQNYSKSEQKTNMPVVPQKIINSQKMYNATMRPYQVFGKWYEPTVAGVGDEFDGIASWYGPDFHQKMTSNGEIYDMYAMTAAHKTLPMNTMVNVLNTQNGKSTVVRINDRGPFVDGRVIDLSNAAAHEIDMIGNGTATVKLTVLGFHSKIAKTDDEKQEKQSVGKFYLQVGAFRKSDGAKITQAKLNNIFGKDYPVIVKEGEIDDKPIFRVFVSGFKSEQEALDFKVQYGLSGSMIIAE